MLAPVTVPAVAACQVLGMAALVAAYSAARTVTTGEAEFVLFWLGMALIELPLTGVIASRAVSGRGRAVALSVLGVVSYAPKLLRDPYQPVFHDEFAHWRATRDIVTSGKLFEPAQIISVISRYPGLHSATAAIVNLTGLTIWQSATVLLLTLHVALLFGIVALGKAIGLGSRVAALAAVLYGFNSSFLYFDTQFAYESMAITLVVWTLAVFVRAVRAAGRRERATWCVLTVFLEAGTTVTHHLSAVDLTLVMALVSATLSVPALARRPGWAASAGTAWALTGVMALAIGLWVVTVAPETIAYLSPYFGTGLTELLRVAGGGGGGRHLFTESLSPWWEHAAAFGVTAVALGFAAGGLLLVRARVYRGVLPPGGRRAAICAFALLGLVYFPSTLFILSPAGAEGARRSWAISWIGLAFVAAPAAARLGRWAGRRRHVLTRTGARFGLAAVLAVSLVGGTAAGLDASYRFPGPFQYGSDSRSDTPELGALSAWFLGRFGPGRGVVTDRYTGLVIASYGLQDVAEPSAGFPVYDLYLSRPGEPAGPAWLVSELGSSRYRYLVVDSRMGRASPQVGVYFEGSEPSGLVRPDGRSPFNGRLGKFDSISWMGKVFQSDNYAVYQMNLPVAGGGYQRRDGDYQVQHDGQYQGKLAVSP